MNPTKGFRHFLRLLFAPGRRSPVSEVLKTRFLPPRAVRRGGREVINNSTSFHPLGLIPSAMDSPNGPRLINVEGSRFGRAVQKLELFKVTTLFFPLFFPFFSPFFFLSLAPPPLSFPFSACPVTSLVGGGGVLFAFAQAPPLCLFAHTLA